MRKQVRAIKDQRYRDLFTRRGPPYASPLMKSCQHNLDPVLNIERLK